ncbi:dihydroorotate dehydrogenase electron transfer subunit [Sporolituus thermophilus]|uniref:dihydroorotate dehydrogenase electron transfer subunit n=1 Tax=Sporolituus thermophilus TaxID=608505 RepID=UPI003CCBFF12
MLVSKQMEQAGVVSHLWLASTIKMLTLRAPVIAQCAEPGQFIHMRVADSYHPLLRRPFSIADADPQAGTISIIYRIVGAGTELLAKVKDGDQVNCLGPLGKAFELNCHKPLLVGGGMGLAPLLFLARRLCPRPVQVISGGRTAAEMVWPALFQPLCENVAITTDDGSVGRRGVTTDLLPKLLTDGQFDRIYACGPRPMLIGVAEITKKFKISCQVSLEEHMACGIGACLACTCSGTDGLRRKICSDGPVFWAEEVLP